MLLEEDIREALAGASPALTAAEGRVYPLLAPQNERELPRITYTFISSDPVYSLQGSSGLDAVRVQLDCWAASYLEAHSLARQVRTVMETASFKGRFLTSFSTYEPEVKLYRVSTDFRCWTRGV